MGGIGMYPADVNFVSETFKRNNRQWIGLYS